MAVYYRVFQAAVFLIIVSINTVLWGKKKWKKRNVLYFLTQIPPSPWTCFHRKHIGLYALIYILNRQDRKLFLPYIDESNTENRLRVNTVIH